MGIDGAGLATGNPSYGCMGVGGIVLFVKMSDS